MRLRDELFEVMRLHARNVGFDLVLNASVSEIVALDDEGKIVRTWNSPWNAAEWLEGFVAGLERNQPYDDCGDGPVRLGESWRTRP